GMKQRIIEDRGSVQNIAEIPAEVKALFKTSWEISQKVVIDHAADRAVYIDQSQSMNLFLADPTYKKIMSMHFYAFDRGLKTGMYYLKMKPPSAPLQVTVSNNNNVTVAPIKKADETVVAGVDGESCTPFATKAKPSKAKPAKAKKDPNAPKKALSAYLLFANENRARIREENPDASFGQIGKLLGAEWKEASEATKQKFSALQEKDKARYAKAMSSYTPGEEAEKSEEEAEAPADEDDDE
ncbi:Ribonucleoside-diphosphate reductase large subunit, partial [Chytriomyces hyalinus]